MLTPELNDECIYYVVRRLEGISQDRSYYTALRPRKWVCTGDAALYADIMELNLLELQQLVCASERETLTMTRALLSLMGG